MPLESWGRYPKARQAAVTVHWRSDPLPQVHGTLLPFGQGRSYGDCCLNDGGTLVPTAALDRFISLEGGLLRCEAGVTLGEILGLAVPRGFFLPVVPGTCHVTVGGLATSPAGAVMTGAVNPEATEKLEALHGPPPLASRARIQAR